MRLDCVEMRDRMRDVGDSHYVPAQRLSSKKAMKNQSNQMSIFRKLK